MVLAIASIASGLATSATYIGTTIYGFTGSGIAAGSAAAAAQSAVGNVAAGSAFSIAQSLAMKGILGAVGASGIGLTSIGIIMLLIWIFYFFLNCFIDKYIK